MGGSAAAASSGGGAGSAVGPCRILAGEGDLGAEETAPSGLGAGSGTGSGHEYPGRAAGEVRDVEDEPEHTEEAGGPVTDSPVQAGEQDQPAPERPPDEG